MVRQFRTLQKYCRGFNLFHFSERHPQLYNSLAVALALLGYSFLMSFPAMVVFGLVQLSDLSNSVGIENRYSDSLLWFAIVVFCIGMTYQILSIKFTQPKGITVAREKIASLSEFISSKDRGPFPTKIQQIMITDQHELDIIKLPVFGIPIWSRNILVIGFSLMQSLPKRYFDCALARKLSQYSLSIHIVTNWLSSLRAIWSLYPLAFKQRNRTGDQIIYWFFRYYARIYANFTVFIKHRHELHADTTALDYINDIDLLKTIESQLLLELYVKQYYWPLITKMLRKNQHVDTNLQPYSTLPAALRKCFDEDKMRLWLKQLYSTSASLNREMPSLCRRMDNIGHLMVKTPDLNQDNAASYYFENRYPVMVGLMNNQWLASMHKQRIGEKAPQKMALQSLEARPHPTS